MKFTIDRAELDSALASTASAIGNRPLMPVLSAVQLSVADDVLTVRATDQSRWHEATRKVDADDDGEVLVSGAVLRELVAAMPAGPVVIALMEDGLTLAAGKSRYRLAQIDAQAWPSWPEAESGSAVSVDGEWLSSIVSKACRVAATQGRPDLCSIALRATGGILRVGSAETRRLIDDQCEVVGDLWALVDPRHLADAIKGVRGAVSLRTIGGLLEVATEGATALLRTIDGEWMGEIDALLPEAAVTVTGSVADLESAAKRLRAIAPDKAALHVQVTPGRLILSLSGEDSGVEAIEAETDGADITLGFSADLLVDALSAIPHDTYRLGIASPMKLVTFRCADETSGFLYLLAPMKIR